MRIQSLNGAASSQKPDRIWITVVSAESSASIAAGQICVFNTNDGMSVVLPATAGAALSDVAIAGVAEKAISAGATGIVQVYGICPSAGVSLRTKASTDATYASISIPAGAVLKPDTVNNCFTTGATVAQSANLPLGAVLVSTNFATFSGVSGSGVAYSTSSMATMPVFLRIL